MHAVSRRAFTGGVAAMAALVSGGAFAAATPIRDGDLAFVDPELRTAARDVIARSATFPELTVRTLPQARQGTRKYAKLSLKSPAWREQHIAGPPGAPDVAVYVINATPGAKRPAILHTHGGGYIFGAAADQIGDLQSTAADLDCVIVTVDYRLAPETTYAGSMEDNYAALVWLYRHAAELGVDPARIAVMGESAGGGHAALLAQTARDRGEVKLILQVLIYPMLDDRTGSTRRPQSPIGTVLWTPPANRFGWRCFLGQQPGGADVPVRAVPARAASLAGLPPAFIGVGSIDLFVDEDVDYAERLINAAVPTELLVVPGAFHGFDGIAPTTSLAKGFAAAKQAALRRAFARG